MCQGDVSFATFAQLVYLHIFCDSGEINGDDLHKILLAIESIFSYLNNRYTKISSLSEEVYKMAKTLYDPAVEQKGIERTALAALKKSIPVMPL